MIGILSNRNKTDLTSMWLPRFTFHVTTGLFRLRKCVKKKEEEEEEEEEEV